MNSELLEAITDDAILSSEHIDTAVNMQQTQGGSLLRCLELSAQDADDTWRRLAQVSGRHCYTTLSSLENLEEAVRGADGKLHSLLPRDLALGCLAVAQRREGETLRVLSPEPLLNVMDDAVLQARAQAVSPTCRGTVVCSVITPALFRTAVRLAYPSGIAGPVSLIDRLAITGLVPRRQLSAYHGSEHRTVEAGIINETDYAASLAAHLALPLYDHRPPNVPGRVLPDDTIRLHHLFPIDLKDGALVVLTARAPDDQLQRNITRISGQNVIYEITTPTVIRALIQKRGRHAD